jgi:DNA-binding CsgD family transcriptional regulator
MSRRPFRGVSTTVVTALGVALVMALVEGPMWPTAPWLALGNVCTSFTLVVAGLDLRKHEVHRGTGWALVIVGVAHPLGWWNVWNFGPFPFYATVFGELDDIFGTWVVMRYPEHRMCKYRRIYLGILATWLIGGRLILAALSRPAYYGEGISPSAWWPAIFPDHRFFTFGTNVLHDGIIFLMLIQLILLMMRLRAGDLPGRQVIWPIAMIGAVGALFAAGVAIFNSSRDPLANVFQVESVGAAFAIPMAFALTRMAISARGRRLAEDLPRLPTACAMEERFRHEFRTVDIHIVYWDIEQRCYINTLGQPTEPPIPPEGCLVKEISRQGYERPAAYVLVGAAVAWKHPYLFDVAFDALDHALAIIQVAARRDDTEYWEKKLSQLTVRERDVLRLMAEERMTTEQIAAELHFSKATIENAKKNIYRKLDIKSGNRGGRPHAQAVSIWNIRNVNSTRR